MSRDADGGAAESGGYGEEGLEIRAKVYPRGCGGTSFKSGRAKGNARKRGGEEKRRRAAVSSGEALLHNAAVFRVSYTTRREINAR